MKRPRNSKHLPSASPIHTAAKLEWNEQVGGLVTARDNWRNAAFGALGVAFLAVGGLAWVSTRPPLPPLVVKVDKLGNRVVVARADLMEPLDPDVIAGQLADWITNIRTVNADVALERRWITRAYALVPTSTPSFAYLNRWFSENVPWERAKNELVTVQVESVTPPPSGGAWQIDWTEYHDQRTDGARGIQHWRATVNITVDRPSGSSINYDNPTWLYVEAMSWKNLEFAGPRS